jgi:hypothetical protein
MQGLVSKTEREEGVIGFGRRISFVSEMGLMSVYTPPPCVPFFLSVCSAEVYMREFSYYRREGGRIDHTGSRGRRRGQAGKAVRQLGSRTGYASPRQAWAE